MNMVQIHPLDEDSLLTILVESLELDSEDSTTYRDEENKRSKKCDDHKDDSHKDPKHPKDTNKDFQDEDKTVGTIFGGVAATKNR